MDRLTLKQTTTLTDIAKFMAEQKDQGATVLAKKDGDGNTVLYTRRGDKDYKGFSGTLSQIKDGLKSLFDGKKAEFAKQEMASFVTEFARNTNIELTGKANQANDGHFAVGELKTLMGSAPDHIQSEASLSTGQLKRVFSSLEVLTESVSRALQSKIDNAPKEPPPLPPTVNKPLEGKREFDHGVTYKTTAPDLEIGGKKFVPEKVLGSGGNGSVFSYVAEDGSRLAVKIPPDVAAQGKVESTNAKARIELANSLKVLEGNPNATGPSQHVVLENGLVALISDIMPNGDLTGLGEKIESRFFAMSDLAETPSGMIGDLERKLIGLTMLKDAANGLSEMNDAKGVTHGDMKSQNVMIDENGVAKLIDLGETVVTKDVNVIYHDYADSDLYLAPEARKLGKSEPAARKPGVTSANTELFANLVNEFVDALNIKTDKYSTEDQERLSNAYSGMATDLASGLEQLVIERNNSDRGLSKTFDTFGLGTMAFELLVGGRATQDVEDAKFTFKLGNKVAEWRETGADFIGEGGLTQRGSGDPEVDRLLNGMLKSDPNERMTAKAVRDDPLMGTKGVGSDEVRELIVALASGNTEAIDIAREKVRKEFG